MIDLTVTCNGVPLTRLNPRLIAQKGLLDEQVEKIKRLHVEAYLTMKDMYETDNKATLRDLAEVWHLIQEELQAAWGFKVDRNYHRWWSLPHCDCPKLDNDDAYPTGRYVMSQDCPIHGLEKL